METKEEIMKYPTHIRKAKLRKWKKRNLIQKRKRKIKRISETKGEK